MRKFLPLALLSLTTAAFAARIEGLSTLKINDKLLIDFKVADNLSCYVSQNTKDDRLIFKLQDCRYGRNETLPGKGVAKSVSVQVKGNDTLVKVAPSKLFYSVKQTPGHVLISLAPLTYVEPEVKKFESGIEIDLKGHEPAGVKFKKVKDTLLIYLEGVKLPNRTVGVNSPLADTVKTYNVGKTAVIQISLNQDSPVKVNTHGTRLEILPIEKFVKNTTPSVAKKFYSDKKISMTFLNADVRSVVSAIADMVGFNVVFDPEVSGKVSADFKKPVPWQVALRDVLDPLGLTYIQEGNILRICPKGKVPLKTYVVHLKYISVKDVINAIKPLLNNVSVSIASTAKINYSSELKNEQKSQTNRKGQVQNNARTSSKFDQNSVSFNSQGAKGTTYTAASGAKKEGKLGSSLTVKMTQNNVESVEAITDTNTLILRVRQSTYKEIMNVISKIDVPPKKVVIPIKYASAMDVAKTLRKLGFKKIQADNSTNSIIAFLPDYELGKVDSIIASIDKPMKEIEISAKIVQVSRSFSKDLGINWGISAYHNFGSTAPHSYGAVSFGFGNTTGIISPGIIGDIYNIPIQSQTLALGFLNRLQNFKVELAIKAAQLEGEGKTISSPKIVTLDNHPAQIEQGIEIPYKEISTTTTGTTTYQVEFKKAVLRLKVKPHIIGNDKIVLDLEVKKDTPDFTYSAAVGTNEPGINTKSIKTRVIIRNGQTLVIGGIYEKTKNVSKNGIPGLQRLPLIGWLFRSKSIQTSNSELLIFITPKIVNSTGG